MANPYKKLKIAAGGSPPAPLSTQKPRRVPVTRRSRWRLWAAMLFGLGVAVAWHFIHQAGERFQPGPGEADFWLHLAVEGMLAVYAAGAAIVAWRLWERFKV